MKTKRLEGLLQETLLQYVMERWQQQTVQQFPVFAAELAECYTVQSTTFCFVSYNYTETNFVLLLLLFTT